jgi:hypothetical protein
MVFVSEIVVYGVLFKKNFNNILIYYLQSICFALIVRKAAQEGKALKTKIVLNYTYDDNYQLKSKARLVVCGYSQIAGVDFQEIYAPTTNNLIRALSVKSAWPMVGAWPPWT